MSRQRLIDLAAGVHGAVAAVEEDAADVILSERFRDLVVVFRLQSVPGGANGRGRGQGQQRRLRLRDREQIQKPFFDNGAGAADGGIELVNVLGFFCLPDNTVEGGVHYGGGCAAVYDQCICHVDPLSA